MHRSVGASVTLLLASVSQVAALPAQPDAYDYLYGNASIFARIGPPGGDPNDNGVHPGETPLPFDLGYITRMAAIGDSYSAGIGSGTRLGGAGSGLDGQSDYDCSRYDQSYPSLIHTDERLGDPSKRKFQYFSCSGAVTQDVLDKQIPHLDGDQQVILLSAGGNDAELSNVLNQCVFQWSSFTHNEVEEIKQKVEQGPDRTELRKRIDWEALLRNCASQLDHTRDIINSGAFASSVDNVLNAAKPKLGPYGRIYYTGYAKFFDERLTDECDSVSWAIWGNSLIGKLQDQVKLVKENRRLMNDLVDLMNQKLKEAVARAGDQVVFVDYDGYAGEFGGRMCGPGVDESSTASNSRTGLMFYELNTWDWSGNTPWKRSDAPPAQGTIEGNMDDYASLVLLADDKATLRDTGSAHSDAAEFEAAKASKLASFGASAKSAQPVARSVLPDGYLRVFHPTILMHNMIANLVIYHMVDFQAQKILGLPPVEEVKHVDNSCPWSPNAPADGKGMQVAIASYIHPLDNPSAWDRLIGAPNDAVPVLVANVVNGPDSTVNEDWKKIIDRTAASGKIMLGYVRTGYLGVSEQQFTTRLGSHGHEDWMAQIMGDVDNWYRLYGDSMGGIFFDEGWNECGEGDQWANVYKLINQYTKTKYAKGKKVPMTVLNPGATMPQCFEDTMDTLMTFESSYDHYVNDYKGNGWTPSNPSKIWHIVYDVPEEKVPEVAAMAADRGAGLIEITNGVMPNPYNTMPSESYFSSLTRSVQAGSIDIGPSDRELHGHGHKVNPPRSLQVTATDYSSVSLRWDLAGEVDFYEVYVNDNLVARFPPYTNAVTIPMLPDGTDLKFYVQSRSGRTYSANSNTVSAKTPKLPGGRTITNFHAQRDGGNTIYKADVLVPYAFLRLFLWAGDEGGCTAAAWPINYAAAYSTCTAVLVEGTNVYYYTGSNARPAPWSWNKVGQADVKQDGHSFTWTLNIDAAKLGSDPEHFIVQGQGYAPLVNAITPCPYHKPDGVRAYCDGQ